MFHLKWLIIDEVSLVGNKLFRFIHWRLQEIKHVYNKPFAGVNILVCGDLSQLKPIGSAWIFQNTDKKSEKDH